MRTQILMLLIFFKTTCYAQVDLGESQNYNFIRDSASLFIELKAMHKEDQRIRSIKNTAERNSKITTSDSINTIRLLDILNKYGYPSKYRFQGEKSNEVPIVVLFDHADMKRSDTLMKLLQREKILARISSNEFELIKWHLNGRVGVPNISDQSGVKVKRRKKWLIF